MSRKRKHEVVEVDSSLDIPRPSVDWNLCILCQCSNEQLLITPSREGYDSLAKNIAVFAEHEALSVTITRTLPCTSSTDLFEILMQNHGKYHKSCRNKYDNQKLQRLLAHGMSGRPKRQGEDSNSTSTRSSCLSSDIKEVCIFCDQSDGVLSAASTLGLGPTIYGHAVQLNDQTLIRKLTCTDMVAMEAKYHKSCYKSFLNRVRTLRRSSVKHQMPNLQQVVYGSVITELVRYMEDIYLYSETSPVFKLNDLTKLVAQRMSNMGVPTTEHDVNRTRLKESLLSFIPGLRADKSGREVILSFENDVGDAITEVCAFNDFSDGMCLSQAASILRRELFLDFPKFQGTFSSDFTPTNCIPMVLQTFVRMVLEGPNIDGTLSNEDVTRTAALSIAQLIRYKLIQCEEIQW